jgi:hypothetical protein
MSALRDSDASYYNRHEMKYNAQNQVRAGD